MDALTKLKKRLFKKGETFTEREGEPTLPEASLSGPRSWNDTINQEAIRRMREADRRRVKRFALFSLITVSVLGLAAAAAVFVILGERAAVTKENIALSIEAPSKITVGEEVPFEVIFRNGNEIPLESVDLIFEYPPGARLAFGEKPRRGPLRERISIGRLLPNEERREIFRAFLFGVEGDMLEARATLEYRPQNSSARFGKDVFFAVAVERSPIGITIDMPNDASLGQELEVRVDYVSTSETILEDISLDILYPVGFEMESASPQPSEGDAIWRIGNVPPGGEGRITVRGTITGSPDDAKFFDVRIGIRNAETEEWSVYGQASRSIRLRDALLAVEIIPAETYQDGAAPGRTISYALRWRNNLPVSVKNVLIEASLSGSAIDYANVRSSNGSYDSARRRILWSASQEPVLALLGAGQSGTLNFSVPVRSQLPIHTLQDRNFEIEVNAVMYTNIVPEGFAGVDTSGSASSIVPVITQMGFISRGFHRSGSIPNTGPMPPRVGEETTYTITWSLTSSANDVENTTVRASIPAYVQWKNRIDPSGESLIYDPNTREITWTPGFVVAGTGYTRPAREVSFQLGVTPGVSHVGDAPIMLNAAHASGRDTFTDTALEIDQSAVTTRILHDTQVSSGEHRVAQ